MSTRRAEKAAATRTAVGDAAVHLFVEQGFTATTVDDIAMRAGISRRSFFNHFATKEAAAFADHVDRLDWLASELGRLEPVTADGVEDLIAEGIADFVRSPSHRDRYRLLLEIPELREQDMRDDLDYELAIAAALEAAGADDGARFVARNTAARLVGAMRAALTTWASAGPEFDPVCAFRAGLRP